MPYAITLRVDDVAARRIRDMFARLAANGISDDELNLGYPPHITISIHDETVDPNALVEQMLAVARNWKAFPVRFSAFGVFPGQPSSLWLMPVLTRELLDRHVGIVDALPRLTLRPHYLPESWVAHVTLAKDLPSMDAVGAALSVVSENWTPFDGVLDRLEVIHFSPVHILCQIALAPNNPPASSQ